VSEPVAAGAVPGESSKDAAPANAAAAADPTLIQLARGGSPWAWLGIAVLIAGLIVALMSVTVLRPGKPKGGGAHVTVAGNPGFSMDYARGELKVISQTPEKVELVDAGNDPQGSRLVVTQLELPAYKGSPTGALPLAAGQARETIAARFDPGATRFVDEGLVNIGPNPGYQLSYVTKRDGITWYGRAAVVVADVDGERKALLMDGQEQRDPRPSAKVVSPRGVGRIGDLRRPMRSLVFVN
jgi:hypothetical protein